MALNPQFGGLIPSGTQELLNSNYLQFNAGTAGNTILLHNNIYLKFTNKK